MKSLAMLAAVLTLGLTLAAGEAEAAKRLGAGKSSGMQRQMTPPAKAPEAAPSPMQAAPATSAAKAPAAAPQAGRSWMGPIAGLAAGLGLAALASHLGFGEELASFLMMGLIALAVMAAIGFFLRRRAAAGQPALAGAGRLQYAGAAPGAGAPAPRNAGLSDVPLPVSGGAGTPANASIPAGFDTAGFVRNAKVYFIRLQAANDAGNLDDIREFTTPEMFAELKLNISERGGAAQETDVVAIDAEVIEVAEEPNRYVASVRFTGQIREDQGPVESVGEVWHLVKARSGSEGWLLAGIQQLQ